MTVVCEGLVVRRGAFRLEADLRLSSAATAIFGPSGAGKSTLLETLAGLLLPVSGRIVLGERTLVDVARGRTVPSRARGVGWVPQEGALFPHLDVRANVLYGARGAEPPSFGRLVEVLELEPLLGRAVAGLSGGERRRVAIARALVPEPRILLLDEPLSGLDDARRQRILPFLERLRREVDVPLLFVTHQRDEAAWLCDEVVLLEAGRVVGQGPPDELLTSAE